MAEADTWTFERYDLAETALPVPESRMEHVRNRR